MTSSRPYPPSDAILPSPAPFMPAPELEEWARSTFIVADAPLENPDHAHLRGARIGVLWTSVELRRQMHPVVGMAEMPEHLQGNKWRKGRQEQQLLEWFGYRPDFLLTFDAEYALEAEDASFCALVEHELYHCGQARDLFNVPKFTKEGRPKFGMRGHDVEEFVGVVRRYGAGAAAGATMDLVMAATADPAIAPARIAGACGTCRAMVAA